MGISRTCLLVVDNFSRELHTDSQQFARGRQITGKGKDDTNFHFLVGGLQVATPNGSIRDRANRMNITFFISLTSFVVDPFGCYVHPQLRHAFNAYNSGSGLIIIYIIPRLDLGIHAVIIYRA